MPNNEKTAREITTAQFLAELMDFYESSDDRILLCDEFLAGDLKVDEVTYRDIRPFRLPATLEEVEVALNRMGWKMGTYRKDEPVEDFRELCSRLNRFVVPENQEAGTIVSTTIALSLLLGRRFTPEDLVPMARKGLIGTTELTLIRSQRPTELNDTTLLDAMIASVNRPTVGEKS